MLDNCGDSVGFPDADVEAPCIDQGRLAGLFLRLHARRFTGLAYVSAQGRTTTFAFRDGTPVMIEASTPETSLADELVERGLLSHDEYAEIIGRVTEELVENEEVAFCQHAVELGYLSDEQVVSELSERVRARLIQALSLTDCEVEFDDSEDVLIGVVEYPQRLGAAVYMGVRTFYEEEVLRGFVPDLKRHYLRLTKSPAEIARFFELDYEEIALLNSIDPQARASTWFDATDLDPTHALQLVALLVIGRMCELGTSAFVPPEAERSGVRAARPEPARSSSRAAMNAVRENQVIKPGSRAGVPAIREEIVEPRAASRAAMPSIREEVVERGATRTGMPAVRVRMDSGAMRDPRAEPNPTRTEGSGAHSGPVRATTPQPSAAATAAPADSQPIASGGAGPLDAAAEALAEARARARDRRGGTYAAQRLGRQIEANRAQQEPSPRSPVASETSARAPVTAEPSARAPLQSETNARSPQAAAPRNAPAPSATAAPEYQKAHLKELWNRRGASQTDHPAAVRRDPARELRQAQELLRDGQYGRAEEQLRGLIDQNPANDTLKVYYLWAQLRAASHMDAGQLAMLRDMAKKLVSDQEHAGFACYVLGHLYFAEKKDDQAEKYFRKAVQIDKSNKDAQRHLVILERRKQQASEADSGGQRKLFGISFTKGGGGKNE